jgi:hypothetical protein
MTTNADRLIATLERWPGLDDDQLARQADIRPRQQVNQICRHLESQGVLRRTQGPEGKIINTLRP